MTREMRIGLVLIVLLGALVFALLTLGSLGGLNPELDAHAVEDVLTGPDPVERFGSEEIRIAGWYAELASDCVGSAGDPGRTAWWLERDCPLRVLMPEQPELTVTQAELDAAGLRLAASDGRPFPSRAEPGGPNLRLQELVFVGHFADPIAEDCAPGLVDRCRATFVVRDYRGLVR